MSYVLVSYSTKNLIYANRLAQKLRDEGFDVWIDNVRLRKDKNGWAEIVKAIYASDAFIPLLSQESAMSNWVDREIQVADTFDKPAFPIVISGNLETSPSWSIYQNIDVTFLDIASLPNQNYYDSLRQVVTQTLDSGRDITHELPDVTITPDIQQEIDQPPTTTPIRLMLVALVVVAIIGGMIFTLPLISSTPESDGIDTPTVTDILSDSNATACMVTAVSTTGETISVRDAPNVGADIVATIADGDTVEAVEIVTGTDADDQAKWIRILYSGQSRYIHEAFLEGQDDCDL